MKDASHHRKFVQKKVLQSMRKEQTQKHSSVNGVPTNPETFFLERRQAASKVEK
jgi:hypothetical protein